MGDIELETKRIVVTGGSGFLGKHVVAQLRKRGCKNIFVPRSKDYDLRDLVAVIRLYMDFRPDIVIHLAASVGGIGANRDNPGSFFYNNAIMGIQLIEQARLHQIDKFVQIGTVCAYPKYTAVPFQEEYLWDGYPEETNAPYGLAKKMLLVQLQAYMEQYGFKSIYLLLVNLYGPGDNFDLDSSHVIPAMIRKFVNAKKKGEQHVVLWGDGFATREFLYVDDAAEGIVLATERYDKIEPVNLGAGIEITIKDLAKLMQQMIGFDGDVVWDATKPNGQPRRCLDVSKAEKEFGFKVKTELEEGLIKTISWYLDSIK